MKSSLVLFVALAVLASGVSAALHSRVANHIEQLAEQRYSFCLHSAAVPSGDYFTAVLFFSFVDADGSIVEHDPSFVLGFPNAEFQLIRNVVSGSAVTVHQAQSSFFNWDAEAYLNTAFTTGVVISKYRLVSVTLVVEAPEIIALEETGKVTCDSPLFFVDEEPMADADVIQQLPNEVRPDGEAQVDDDVVVFEFSNEVANETAPSLISWIYLGSTALVAFMSLACMLRVCCARRQQRTTEADEEMMMVPLDEQQQQQQQAAVAVIEPLVPLDEQQLAMQPQPVMTASGVQYIMVPQEFLLAAAMQQQQQQLAAMQAAGMSLYPGHFVAAPQQ